MRRASQIRTVMSYCLAARALRTVRTTRAERITRAGHVLDIEHVTCRFPSCDRQTALTPIYILETRAQLEAIEQNQRMLKYLLSLHENDFIQKSVNRIDTVLNGIDHAL